MTVVAEPQVEPELSEWDWEPLPRLSIRDVRAYAEGVSARQMRYLIDLYYQVQRIRITADNQVRSEPGENRSALAWLAEQAHATEATLRRVMAAWAEREPEGRWLLSVRGIGPVLAAGVLATFPPDEVPPTVGKWWRFAGVDPSLRWEPGQPRPFCRRAKVVLWKVADAFVKAGGFYRALYDERKAYEIGRNERGELADQAQETLATRRISDPETLAWYRAGKLPPGRIDLRARRWVAKLFLSHYHEVIWRMRLGSPPPLPFAIARLGHADYIAPPGLDEEAGPSLGTAHGMRAQSTARTVGSERADDDARTETHERAVPPGENRPRSASRPHARTGPDMRARDQVGTEDGARAALDASTVHRARATSQVGTVNGARAGQLGEHRGHRASRTRGENLEPHASRGWHEDPAP
jgi:hypothetical protein